MLLENIIAEEIILPDFRPDTKYLRTVLASREADSRESILFRQGKGFFCLPSAGHENMAAVAYALMPNDYIYCHYRDRALMIARGVNIESMALGYFAKKGSSSVGRQLASHFSSPAHNVVSLASPTASQCIPAAGTAWAEKMKGDGNIIVCCVGDASIRQGEFYEAFCLAIQESLPIIFIVEDNGYGISTPTQNMNPLNMGVFAKDRIIRVNGKLAEPVFNAMYQGAAKARAGEGPSLLWIKFDRLMSHTSSDDQRQYRPTDELLECSTKDPIILLRNSLYDKGELNAQDWENIEADIRSEITAIYARAENAEEPDIKALMQDVRNTSSRSRKSTDFLRGDGNKITFSQAVTKTLSHLLAENEKVILFGQDIEDPKGGVFGLTKGLSTEYPKRVVNAPLAEATICGTAVGLAIAGYVPIFEIQFIDFMGTGFNQIANQMATMRWRTGGEYKCPIIILAPCGGYINGGGPWHTQTNECQFAHIPGLQVYMPSNATDVADLIVNCANGENPALILLPKQLFFKEFSIGTVTNIHHEGANIVREGTDVTLVSWGNCVELTMDASDRLLKEGISSEVIDLKSIVPMDMHTLSHSLNKTGRFVVIHEDNRTCSVGQAIISEIVTNQHTWDMLYSPPIHICRDDVLVPFNPGLAQAVLPSTSQIMAVVKSMLGR